MRITHTSRPFSSSAPALAALVLSVAVAPIAAQQAMPAQAGEAQPATMHGAATPLGRSVDEALALLGPGETKFLLTGSAETTFTSARDAASNFSTVFEPLFLWHLSDKVLFEGEMEFELEDHSTASKLEFAQIDLELNDNLTLIGGKFLSPLNSYMERYAPIWIRKLPDGPLGIHHGFLPEAHVGFQLRGVVPMGDGRLNFQSWVANAPRLVDDDAAALGTLDFENYESQADGKAYGGRIGYQMCPNMELGYAAQYARVRDVGTDATGSLLQSLDLAANMDALDGRFALLGQYARSNVSSFVYDAAGALGVGPLSYANDRDGGYLQLSYRGRQWGSDLMNRLEFVLRADFANAPNLSPGGFDERRVTVGCNYWVAAATVVRTAFAVDDRNNGEADASSFFLQLSTGF